MGFDNTFLFARWERPLTGLEANSRLRPVEMRGPDPGLSWTRADGWQCLAPEGAYYDGELVPPVPEIAVETGGPVLGAGDASYIGIFGALAIPQVGAEDTLFDLLKLLTLVPEADDADGTDRAFLHDAWWLRDVPDAVYAIEAGNIRHRNMQRPAGDYGQRDLVLAFTDRGVGLWSLQESRWEKAPTAEVSATLEDLRARLRRQGWTPWPPPSDS